MKKKETSSLKTFFSESYTPKLLLLAYIPTIVIIIFTIINVDKKIINLKAAKQVQEKSFNTIAIFYELNYFQDERFWSLIYNLKPNKKYQENLASQYSISYEYIKDLEPKYINLLPKMRTDIISKTINLEQINLFYSDSIRNFIKKTLSNQKLMNNNLNDFSNMLDSYELTLKLSEVYYKNLSLIINHLKNKDTDLSYEILRIKEREKFLKTLYVKNLPQRLETLFNKNLENNIFTKIDNYLDDINNGKNLNLTTQDLISLHDELKNQFYNLSNHTTSIIQDLAMTYYEKEFNSLVTLVVLSFLSIIIIHIFGIKLKNLIISNFKKNMKEISSKNDEIQELHKYIDKYIILSKTDLKGKITYVSDAFCDISKYKNTELLGKPHNIVRHPDMSKEAFHELWSTVKEGKTWSGEVKNLKKDGGFYWTKATVGPSFNSEGEIVGYTSIRQDITQQKYAQYLNLQIQSLLDNANNGFLSFDKDLKVKDGYSKVSLDILSQNSLTNKYIADVLFHNSENKKETFELGIGKILEANDDLSKDILLSLLPSENTINNKIFSIKYKIIKDDEFMVILEDITETVGLKKKIEYENRIQKMIVAIATRKNEFIELKNDFFDFLADLESLSFFSEDLNSNVKNITKTLHTFKGLFAQEELANTTQEIHDLETEIINKAKSNELTKDNFKTILEKNSLRDSFNKDLDLIGSILGPEYLGPQKNIKFDMERFKEFEHRILDIFKNKPEKSIKDFELILKDFLSLNQKSLKSLLSIYPSRVENIAQRLNKKIHTVKIIGDDSITVRNSYQNFINSLVHVFRNIVDHGIESPKDRLNMNKYEKASIICQYKLLENSYIQLIISDDGKGIDPGLIKLKAIEQGLFLKEDLEKMDDKEIINLIFEDNFSTKESADLLSGRGVGLSSVKKELEKIKGEVEVKSVTNIGTKFIFTFPAEINQITNDCTDYKVCICSNILSKTKLFFEDNLDIKIEQKEENSIFKAIDYNTIIKLQANSSEYYIVINYEKNLLNEILQRFTGVSLSEEEALKMYQDISNESLNTILGNSLDNLSKDIGECEISTPLNLDIDLIKNFSSTYGIVSKTFNTDFGNFNLGIITIKE